MLKNLVLGSLLLVLLGLGACQKLEDALADKKLLAVEISIARPDSASKNVNSNEPVVKSYGFVDSGNAKYAESTPAAFDQFDTTEFLSYDKRKLLLELSFIDASTNLAVQTLTQELPYSQLFDATLAVGRFSYENLSNTNKLKVRLAIYDPVVAKLLNRKLALLQHKQEPEVIYSDMAKDFLLGRALGLKFEAKWNTLSFQLGRMNSFDWQRDKYYTLNAPLFVATSVEATNGTVPYFLFNTYGGTDQAVSYPPHAVVSPKTFKATDSTSARLAKFFEQINR